MKTAQQYYDMLVLACRFSYSTVVSFEKVKLTKEVAAELPTLTGPIKVVVGHSRFSDDYYLRVEPNPYRMGARGTRPISEIVDEMVNLAKVHQFMYSLRDSYRPLLIDKHVDADDVLDALRAHPDVKEVDSDIRGYGSSNPHAQYFIDIKPRRLTAV